MLSSGVECLLDSSACTGTEDLHKGLPLSIPAGLMAVSEAGAGLDAKPDVSLPELAHSSELSSEHHRTWEAKGFGEEAEHLDDVVRGVHREPAEPLTEELLQDKHAEQHEENKRTRRKQDCSSCEYQQGGKEAQDAEEDHAECCALKRGEKWLKQEDPHLDKHEVNSSATCGTEIAGSLKSKGENQANFQVTAETLPKLTEEAQGMKADGTRIFSKAGFQNGSVSKGLPPESDECPDVDTVMARAGVSETTGLDFIEPLNVMDMESTTEHSKEISEYNGLKAHADTSLRTGGNVVSILETTEEKLPRQNLVNEFNTSLDSCQTYQQDEENNACDFCTVVPPKHNEPVRLSSVESCRMLSIKNSEVICSVLESVCYLDFRNMSLDNNSTAIHGIINETAKKHLPESMASQTNYDHRTGFVEDSTSKSMPVEHLLVLRNKQLSSNKTGDRKTNDSTGKSYSSEFEEAAEIQREIAVGGNAEAQESADSEHCHSSVFSSIASSSEEFSKEKLKMIPSEASKWEKNQLQFSISDLYKDDAKESSLLKEMNSIASNEIGQTDVCIYKSYSKISTVSSHDCQDLSAKLEEGSPEVQLLEKESQSNTALEFSGKETNLICTLNVILPPVTQKSREPHCDECLFCTAREVPSKDKAEDNLSGKESLGSSEATEEQLAEFVLHKDKFQSSINPKTSDESSMTSNISQKNRKSSERKVESVDTGLENEHSNTWNSSNQSLKDQHTAATTSSTLSSRTHVDDVVLNSHFFKADVEMKIDENDSLEGEASAGCNSKKAIIFLEEHCPLACRSLPYQDAWGNRCVALHGINDISTEKSMFCLTYAAEESTATLVGDEISNKNMKAENTKQFDLCKLTDSSEIICDKDEAKDQVSTCAVPADEFDKIRTLSSPKVPGGNWRSKTGEQLLVRYLNKKNCVHNFGFCNSPLRPKMRELGTSEKKGMSSLTASSSEYSSSICATCPLLNSINMQTEKTLSPTENQFLAHQSEFYDLVPGSKQHLETLNKKPNTGLQFIATSAEETKLSISSGQYEERLFKKGDDLTLLVDKHVREDGFQRTVKENVVDFESSTGLRNADCSGCMGSISDLIQEKMKKLKEKENSCGSEDKETLEESLSDSRSQCSQHALSIKCVKDKAELVFSGNKMQQSLAKMKWLIGDQANTVSAPFLPFSSIHESLFYKPEKMHVLSEMENKRLRKKSILNNSCSQLMLEPGKEIDAKKDMGPSYFVKFNIQDSSNETHRDSETPSALNLGNSLPQKEKLCMSSENTDIGNSDSSSDEICSKGSSVTKPLSVTMYVKSRASNTEIPSSEDEKATSSLKGAKSSGVHACNKERQRDERRSVLTAEVMDVTLPKSADCGKKLKNVCVEEKMEREVSHRKKLPIHSFLDGEDCLWTSLEGSKESSSKTFTVSTENYEKGFEEIPRSDLNSLSKERNAAKPTSFTDSSSLSEAVQDYQTADASDRDASPEFKNSKISMLSNSCKDSLPNYVVRCEVCVPYKLNAQSRDNAKEITGCQDTIPAHSVSMENETSDSVRLDRVEKCQALKRKKKYEEIEVHGSDKAKQEKKAEYKVKAKVTLHPSILYSSELLCSSSDELVMSRNTKFESPSEDVFVIRSSENKLCSTLQEIKRPKITTDTISSCFLKTQDSEMENLNLKSGYNGILGAFGTKNKLRGPLPLKIQPGRTCKKVPTSYQLETVRKIKKPKSSAFLEPPSEMPPKQENTVLKSLYFAYKSPTVKKEIAMRFVHMPRQKAKRCSLLSSLKFRKCTKEPALLSKLSAVASKLLEPATSIHSLETLPYSSEILPVAARYSQRRSKNLLEAVSCINRSLHSRWADSWCTKMFSFQSFALYSVGSTKIPSLDLSNNSPSFLDTPVFPISFHVKLDSSSVTDLTWTTSQHSVHHRLVLEEMPAPPSKWTFLLSQSCSDATTVKEDSSQDHEPHSPLSVTTPGVVALHPDHGRNAIAKRTGSCSMLGLHTVLALSSPGCYRIWTRRRNLTSHIPTIQRLLISQFTQGLKGASNVSDDLVSSLPYSLGRALSIWSQHGPSACPSEITPLHSNHCKWQPSVGIESSYAILPHLPVQRMEALQTAGHEICLEPSFPLPLPKSCLLSEALPPRLPEPELQVHALDEADTSIPDCFRSQDDTELKKTEPEKRPKKVSQIRIRKTIPRLDHNLTPMGLPKPKRLKKKEFSLEEIYTNKNYKSPPPARSLETIFEEPKEKNGLLISVSQQKRKRILEFQDFTVPRKRKARGKIKAVGSFTRAKKAAPPSAELDALLSQKLMDLEEFFAKEDEQELLCSTGGSPELKMVQ